MRRHKHPKKRRSIRIIIKEAERPLSSGEILDRMLDSGVRPLTTKQIGQHLLIMAIEGVVERIPCSNLKHRNGFCGKHLRWRWIGGV